MIVSGPDIAQLQDIACRFRPGARHAAIREYGKGNINRTYLVTPPGGEEPFLLQRLNTRVFKQPELVMRNIGAVLRHLEAKMAGAGSECDSGAEPGASRGDGSGAVSGTSAGSVSGTSSGAVPGKGLRDAFRWEIPHVLLTAEGTDHFRSPDGAFWRAQRFIGGSKTAEAIQGADQAREIGRALGTFHALLCDLPAADLADTLPGFHVAPGYLAHYDRVLAAVGSGTSAEEEWCARFIARHRDWVPVLEQARERGILRIRPIHGDPKVNNILLDETSGKAIGMIDLDTVKPGLVQYDIGDCLRSSCNPAGEEAERWQEVEFDPVLGRAVLEGYLEVAREFFDDADFDFVPASVRLIAFELGLRFFTDHLEGDVYFKVARRGQNLARALVQLRLAQSIDQRFDELKSIVEALR